MSIELTGNNTENELAINTTQEVNSRSDDNIDNIDNIREEEKEGEQPLIQEMLHTNDKVNNKVKAGKAKKEKVIKEAKEEGIVVATANLMIDRYYVCPDDFEVLSPLIDHYIYTKNEDIKADVSKLKPESDPNFIIAFENFEYTTTGLGLVLYMAPECYSDDKEKNTDDPEYDFKINKIDVLQMLLRFFIIVHNIPVDLIKTIIVGHEWSPNTGKAHYQCCVQFAKSIKRKWFSYKVDSGSSLFYLMMEKAKNSKALINYCKKDGDFAVYGSSELSIKIVYRKGPKDELIPDVPATIANNSDKNPDELKKFLFNKFPGYMISNYNNVNNAINAFCKEQLPEFKWNIPSHLEQSTNILHQAIVDHIKKYFITDDERSKALIIAGPQNTGKTKFALSLVNHEGYACYFRQNFEKSQEKMLEGMKLLILDDFTYMESKQHETFKALFSGEKTTLEAKWMQTPLKAGYRTIFLTNNLEFVKNICSQPDFDGRYNLVVLETPEEDYLGPDGTYRKDLNVNENWHTKSLEITSYLKEARRFNFQNGTTFTEQNRNKLDLVETDLGLKVHKGNLKKKEYSEFRTGVVDKNPYEEKKLFDIFRRRDKSRSRSKERELEKENKRLRNELENSNRKSRELERQVNNLEKSNKYLGFRNAT